MTKTKNDPLAAIGGLLVLVLMIAPFCAIWIASYRLEFGLTAVWAAILGLIIVKALKPEKDTRAKDALIFVEHIANHLRQWEKDKNLEPNSLKVMCKICDKPIEKIIKEKGAGS